jgi:putative DNA methylase
VIPKDCKRLAEVDFPIADVSKHAAREKSIRHGHPSTLHLWWARRPLASSRAILLALLWPDPCDPLCPPTFKTEARKRLREVGGCNPGTTDEDLRKALLRFIANFANWDNAANRTYLNIGRALVKAAHASADGGAYEPPLVVDPFAGGGSIPLEALRVGCEAFASDLNPVACLILKVMLEEIPRHGSALAEELRHVGGEIKTELERALADVYPKDPDGATPIAYLWARSVRCESTDCGAEIPLVRSLWLSKRSTKRRALRVAVRRPTGQTPVVELEVFEPPKEVAVQRGTAVRARAICPACGRTMSPDRVRRQLAAIRGGANPVFEGTSHRKAGCRLLAVVTNDRGGGREYRSPREEDYRIVSRALKRVVDVLQERPDALPTTEALPMPEGRNEQTSGAYFNFLPGNIYGIETWSDLFTARQQLALLSCVDVFKRRASVTTRFALGAVLGRCADYWSAGATWAQEGEFVRNTFGRHALPVVFDFAEACPLGGSSGSLDSAFGWVLRVIEAWPQPSTIGQVEKADARRSSLPDQTAQLWFTDPPYYDAVPYSYISNFFLTWLKRLLVGKFTNAALGELERGMAPSDAEIIDTLDLLRGCDKRTAIALGLRLKDRIFFELGMAEAFGEGKRVLSKDGVGCVVFAHKTTEGWEALLSGLISGGWTITASWPLATERPGRLRSQNSSALATSVHLICRPRPLDAAVGDWATVLRELPVRVADWMDRLQGEGVRGADLVFACIGPALELFSRYASVETAEGRQVKLDEYLQKVWEVVGRSALAQVLGTAEAKARNGAAGAVEEDARLTALFLWTLQATEVEVASDSGGSEADEEDVEDEEDEDEEEDGPSRSKPNGFTLVFDVVRRFAQPLGIELPKWEGRVIETKKGVVRLLPIAERAKQLFGEDGAHAVASRLEEDSSMGLRPQLSLFPEARQPELKLRARRGRSRSVTPAQEESVGAPREATTLDRVHAAMLLQASGRTNALRALLNAEQERGPDFLRLANALSALYPKGSEEKRLLDAMLLAAPR